jgi:hypothetical protein
VEKLTAGGIVQNGVGVARGAVVAAVRLSPDLGRPHVDPYAARHN